MANGILDLIQSILTGQWLNSVAQNPTGTLTPDTPIKEETLPNFDPASRGYPGARKDLTGIEDVSQSLNNAQRIPPVTPMLPSTPTGHLPGQGQSRQPMNFVDQISSMVSNPVFAALLGALATRSMTPKNYPAFGPMVMGGMQTMQGTRKGQMEEEKMRQEQEKAARQKQWDITRDQMLAEASPEEKKQAILGIHPKEFTPEQIWKIQEKMKADQAAAQLNAGATQLVRDGKAKNHDDGIRLWLEDHPTVYDDLSEAMKRRADKATTEKPLKEGTILKDVREEMRLDFRRRLSNAGLNPDDPDVAKDPKAIKIINEFADEIGKKQAAEEKRKEGREERSVVAAERTAKAAEAGIMPTIPAGASGEEVLKGVDPGTAAIVKKITNYEIPLPSSFALRQPQWMKIMQLASLYDPSFDAKLYNVRMQTQLAFKVKGKPADNIRSLNTVVGHLDTLKDAASELENGPIQLWNRIANYGLTATMDDPRVTNFSKAANAVAGELSNVFKGTSGTDQEIKSWRAEVNSSQGPRQLKEGIDKAIELIASRINVLGHQYETAMGKSKDFNILTSKARETLQKIGVNPDTIEPVSGGGKQPTGTPDQVWRRNPQTGQLERVP